VFSVGSVVVFIQREDREASEDNAKNVSCKKTGLRYDVSQLEQNPPQIKPFFALSSLASRTSR
jgi:hypothetical protein